MLLRKELEALALPYKDLPADVGSTPETPPLLSMEPTPTTATRTISTPSITDNTLKTVDEKSKKDTKKLLKSEKGHKGEDKIKRNEHKEKLFMRPGVIDEEPDSVDSIISDPSSFPITVVPSSFGGGVLIRNSTAQSSFSRMSRMSSSSK